MTALGSTTSRLGTIRNRLLHYSNAPVRKVARTKQGCDDDHSMGYFAKPRGLWLSVEGDMDWHEWCVSEHFRDIEKQVCHEVVLKPKANILTLKSAEDLRVFTHFFAEIFSWGPGLATRWVEFKIRWDIVAKHYDGIIIAPYIWSERLGDLSWYYPWDCASGCIWNPRAIKEINVVPMPIKAREMEEA